MTQNSQKENHETCHATSAAALTRLLRILFTTAVLLNVGASSLLYATEPDTDFYRPRSASDPILRATVLGPLGARAWIDFAKERYHAIPGMALGKDLVVEEIRREEVLLKSRSTGRFLRIPVNTTVRPRYHREWSIWGDTLTLWESLEILAHAFGYNVVMHPRAGAPVVPRAHGDTMQRILSKILPPHHRIAFNGPVLLVLPTQPGTWNWAKLVERLRVQTPERLVLRYPGLGKPGTILSRGDDVQFTLRRIAVGAGIPIQFPKDLHLPIYASLRGLPFFQILANITYPNGLMMIDRETGLEIQPWPEGFGPGYPPSNEEIRVGPGESYGPTAPGPNPAPLPLDALPVFTPLPVLPVLTPGQIPPNATGQDSN
ncbi:MAG: hypothetical protein WA705_08315 [Candidatus Ozemobacteraceae bacterium]